MASDPPSGPQTLCRLDTNDRETKSFRCSPPCELPLPGRNPRPKGVPKTLGDSPDRSVHNNWKAIRTVVQNTLPTDESGSVVVRASIRKPSEGKPRNVVIAAVANRWIRKLYRQMQPDQLAYA